MNGKIVHVNPDGLMKSPSFSQVVTTRGSGTTIYIGGQNPINSNGKVIGKGDIHAQTAQVMYNIETALRAYGATFDHVVKMTIYIVDGQDVSKAFQASQQVVNYNFPPSITTLIVSGLSNPDYFIEIDAIAFLPE